VIADVPERQKPVSASDPALEQACPEGQAADRRRSGN
jgi:hypothetical protein